MLPVGRALFGAKFRASRRVASQLIRPATTTTATINCAGNLCGEQDGGTRRNLASSELSCKSAGTETCRLIGFDRLEGDDFSLVGRAKQMFANLLLLLQLESLDLVHLSCWRV